MQSPLLHAPGAPSVGTNGLPSLDALRFLYVTGKGGVGKSTATAALARALATRGRRVLVCMTNAKERMSGMLGCAPIGPEIVSAAPNIDAVNMEPRKCLEEYGVMILKVKALYKALFENRYVDSFFRAVPGLYEWSMLGKAWFHTTELLSGGTTDDSEPPYADGWKYETVIVDGPATGHGLDMLRVPRVLLDVAPAGPMRKEAERAWRLFQDPGHAGVVLVTLPEEMPANETLELADGIREMNLPIPRLVVNGLLPPLFDAEHREQIASRTLPEGLSAAHARASRERIQEAALQKLATMRLPTTYLPFLVGQEPSSPQAILALAHYL
jgi:anion-transporting  ArsA/GET3 family ATPase